MHDTLDSHYSHILPEPDKGPADARVLGTGMHVWEIAWTARNYDNLDEMAESLGLDCSLLEEGMRFAGEHPKEVAAAIEDNDSWTFERLREVLPGIRLFSPSIDGADEPR